MLCRRVLIKLVGDCQNRFWKHEWRGATTGMRPNLDRCWSSFNVFATEIPPQCCAMSHMSGRKLDNSLKPEAQNVRQSSEKHGKIADFERALFRRLERAGFKRSKRFFWTVLVSSILAFAGGYLYLFPHKLRQQVVEEVSTVASQSLEDEKIVTKAGQLSKDVLNAILNDGGTKVVASDFVKDVIVSDPIRDAAIDTILRLLNDPEVLKLLRTRLSEIILTILQDESTRQIVLSQVNAILQHDSIRQSLQVLLSDLTNTPEVQKMMSDFFRDVLASDTVKNQGAILGQQVTADVISSKDIQEQAGNAIWSALKHSVIPNVFKGRGDTSKNATNQENERKDEVVENSGGKAREVTEAKLDVQQSDFDIPIEYSEEVYNRYNRYGVEDDM